ncbi:MFS transporter [Actinokineospora guangxiensis]|uniref:MFS transporter n=1 Tax=Actinokineospora guangxiensis TaxID=1490288 RepID=A0ABW0ET60_9PSEU
MTATRSLNRDRVFTLYWSAVTTSGLSGAYAALLLPLLVLRYTGSLAQMGLVTAASTAVGVVATVAAGPLVDRLDRPRLMLVCDLVRVVLFAALAVTWAVAPQMWLLYVCAAVSAGMAITFRVAHVTLVPVLVSSGQIVAANSRLEATGSLAILGGPLLAGVAVSTIGPATALSVNVLLLLWSALAVWLIRRPSRAGQEANAGQGERQNWWRSYRTGWRFLWGQPVLRWLMVLLTLLTFVTAPAEVVLIYFLTDELGADSGTVGLILSLAGLGGLLAAVVTPYLRRRLGFAASWFGAFAIVSAGLASISLTSSIWAIGVVAVAFIFGISVAGICSMSLRQQITPGHLLGRVTALFWAATTSLAPAGTAILTALATTYGVRTVTAVAGFLCLAVLALALLTPLRSREPAPAEERTADE